MGRDGFKCVEQLGCCGVTWPPVSRLPQLTRQRHCGARLLPVHACMQAASTLLSDASEALERISKYSARLGEVRERRLAMAAALTAAEAGTAGGAGDRRVLFDQDDTMSEASMVSGFSMYTDRTALGTGTDASSSSGSSRAPSTVGGRKAMKRQQKAAAKRSSKKIRAGSPGEEAALEVLLLSLAPARHVLEEAGQLSELLVMLQHGPDAAKLQQRVGQWQAAAAAAAELARQGQQQQAHPAAASHAQAAAAGAAVAQRAAAAAVADVHWKWDVLREHKV